MLFIVLPFFLLSFLQNQPSFSYKFSSVREDRQQDWDADVHRDHSDLSPPSLHLPTLAFIILPGGVIMSPVLGLRRSRSNLECRGTRINRRSRGRCYFSAVQRAPVSDEPVATLSFRDGKRSGSRSWVHRRGSECACQLHRSILRTHARHCWRLAANSEVLSLGISRSPGWQKS